MLLAAVLQILEGWIPAFAQQRSGRRAVVQALGSVLSFGRRTLSRSLWALGRQDRDWSAEYKLHARCRWSADALFQPILVRAIPLCPGPYLVVAMDDTRIRKTGRKILSAFYQRDPLSPKFRFNLMWGLRFLQMTLIVPLYRSQPNVAPRSLPIRFQEAPALKRPGQARRPPKPNARLGAKRSKSRICPSIPWLCCAALETRWTLPARRIGAS